MYYKMQNLKTKYQNTLTTLLDLGILVAKSDEQAYIKKHNLNLVRLNNGAKLLTALSPRIDFSKSTININFTAGARFDPDKKSGLAHLLEHLFFDQKFDEFFAINQAMCNAGTTSDYTKFIFGGDVNFDYPTYALPAVIDKSFSIVKKLHGIADEFESTKSTIKNEIENYIANYDRRSIDAFKNYLFDKNSAWVINVLGTKHSLDLISKQDVLDFHKKYFGPANMLVYGLVESDAKQYQLLNSTLLKKITELDKAVELNSTDFIMSDIVNDQVKFNTGHLDKHTLEIKNQLITTYGYLKFKIPLQKNLERKALNIITTVLAQKVFELSRVAGLSYKINSSYFLTADDDFILYVSSVDGCDDWQAKFEKFKVFLSKILSQIDSFWPLFENELQMEKIRQVAVPISQSNVLNQAVHGLFIYDHLYDVDKNREAYRTIENTHIEYCLQLIKNLELNYFCVGDLK